MQISSLKIYSKIPFALLFSCLFAFNNSYAATSSSIIQIFGNSVGSCSFNTQKIDLGTFEKAISKDGKVVKNPIPFSINAACEKNISWSLFIENNVTDLHIADKKSDAQIVAFVTDKDGKPVTSLVSTKDMQLNFFGEANPNKAITSQVIGSLRYLLVF